MFLGKKWDDKKLLTIGSAYQREIWSGMRDLDKPIIMPMTELRDVVRLRQEKELSSSKPQL